MKDKKVIIGRVILILIVIIAIATNPSKEDFDNYCFRKSRNMSTVLGRFELEPLDRDNYLLFSIYKAKVTFSGSVQNETVKKYIGLFDGFGSLD